MALAAATIVSLLLLPDPLAIAIAEETSSSLTRNYALHHSLGPSGSYVPRGSIRLVADLETNKIETTVTPPEDGSWDAKDLDELVKSGGLYKLKVTDEGGKTTEDGASRGSNVAMASVSACSLRRANFREEIGLTLSDDGDLRSVSYSPLVSPLAPECRDLEPLSSPPSSPSDGTSTEEEGSRPPPPATFKTAVTYETAVPGMTIPLVLPPGSKPPPGLKFFPRTTRRAASVDGGGGAAEGVGGGGGGGGNPFRQEGVEDGPPQSFLRKYWYIILPVMILTLTGGQEEEAAPPGGGGRQAPGGSGSAAAAGAAATTAAGGGGGGQVRRRGKRG